MTISAAMAEAYASNDVKADLLCTLQFDHPTFANPLRFVRGTRVPEIYEKVLLPVPGDAAAEFLVVDFGWQRPGQEEGGTTKARIRVDNVSRALQEALRAAISSDKPFEVTYREYLTSDPNHPEIYDGLRMGSVSVTALSASGDLYYEEIEMKAFPGQTYSLDLYPALYGQ
ncbi:DUF1833 domain-containing protein [Bosea minatitlanensis]|uniref:DUF1833 domain-containing protein n=1 Tax=Bosea minatitlanensis TaxID=128782 RepID=A0ABW0F2P1_9HYPH|nr:DUF1833 domain-containing protein [Bosea minatitlanensis]MCT4492703.1 DUF1833 domain-containing protein [Bosea minatitlanensis]